MEGFEGVLVLTEVKKLCLVPEKVNKNERGDIVIKVETYKDDQEKKQRIVYQFVELLIYAIVSLFKFFRIDILKDKDGYNYWFDGFGGFKSVPLTQIREFASLSKSLDMIYNYFDRFNIRPHGLSHDWCNNHIVKMCTDFWVKMPIGQDVRSRLALVAELLENKIEEIHNKKGDVKIVMLAGGTKQDVIMAISNLSKKIENLNIKVVCVEPDRRALPRASELVDLYGLKREYFKDIRKMVDVTQDKRLLSSIVKDYGYEFSDFDLVVCIGLGDYMFDEKLIKFLQMLDNGNCIITANICGNFIERRFLHDFIEWPKMQYLSLSVYKEKLRAAFGSKRRINIIRTPHKIFNVAIIE